MSRRSRNQFDALDQQANDFYRGIKTIKPVISIIRELGKKEKKFSKNKVELWIEGTNLSQLSAAFSLFKINGINKSKEEQNLESETKKKFEMLTKLDENLYKEINELQVKVNEYLYYIDESFIWVNEGVLKLGIERYCSKLEPDDLLAILLIIFNRGLDDFQLELNEEVIADIFEEYFIQFNFVPEVLQHDLEKVIEFIKET